jgi:hypothetical protein
MFTTGLLKVADVLNAAERKKIPAKDFALSGAHKGKTNEGKYPIPDESHARNALARVSQFGTPEEQAQVRAKVHAKFPNIGKDHKDE